MYHQEKTPFRSRNAALSHMLFLPDRLNLKSVLSSYHHQVVLQVNLNQHCSSDWIPVCFWSVGFSKVCDANSRWYLADSGSDPGVVLLLTGRSLSHDTSGFRCAASYRAASDFSSSAITAGRFSICTGHQWHLSSCHKAMLYWNVLQFLQPPMSAHILGARPW